MRLTLRIALACAALLSLPTAAHAGFTSQPIRISGDTDVSTFPAVAADGRGDMVVIWTERVATESRLLARRVHPDGTLGAVLTISDGTMLPVQRDVVVTPAGRALVVWNESTTGAAPRFLRARWIEADDTLGSQILLRNAGAGASADNPVATVTTDGDATVAWRNSVNMLVEAREVGANSVAGTLLQPPDGPGTSGPDIAPTAAGGALVAWTGPPAIRAMPVNAAGAAGTVQTPVATGVITSPRLSSGGPGRIRIVWPPVGEIDQQLAALDVDAAGVAVGARQSLLGGTVPAMFPQVAGNAAGRSVAAWDQGLDVASRFIGADGIPEPATFTAPAQAQFVGGADVLDDGTGILLWTQGELGSPRALWSRVIGPDGIPAGPQQLAPANASSTRIASSPDGVGLVVWDQGPADLSGAPTHVEALQFLPPPSCADASATVVQGRPTRVSLACTGLQLTAPQVLSAPANGSLSSVDPATGSVVYTPRPGFKGNDTFTFRGTNRGGPGPTQTARITVGKDTVAPVVRSFRVTLKRVRLRTAFLPRAKKRPAFRLRFSEPSTAKITIQRRRGKRLRTVGTLVLRTAATDATLRLPKRLRGRVLAPGTYRATLVATDLALNRSAPERIRFTVTRR